VRLKEKGPSGATQGKAQKASSYLTKGMEETAEDERVRPGTGRKKKPKTGPSTGPGKPRLAVRQPELKNKKKRL